MNTKYKKYVSSAVFATAFMTVAAIMVPFSGNLADAATVGITESMGGPGGGMGMNWSGGNGANGGRTMNRPVVFGTVESINGTTLTVTEGAHGGFGSSTVETATTTYTVDASTATVMKANATSTVSNIAVGDMVAVQGTANGTNVTATSIRDGFEMRTGPAGGEGGQNGFHHMNSASSSNNMPVSPITGNGQPVIAGTISAINGSSVTITNKSNVSYTVDVSNAKIVEGQNTITASNLTIGDNVIIQGSVSGTSVTASSVIDQKALAAGTASSTGPRGNGGGIFGMIGGFFSHIFGF